MTKVCTEVKGYEYTNFKGNKVVVPTYERCREGIPKELEPFIDDYIIDNWHNFKN